MSFPSPQQVLGLSSDENVSSRSKTTFQTTRHTLTAASSGDISSLCSRFESLVNDGNVRIVEISPYTTVDGEPYVVLRTRKDASLPKLNNTEKASFKWDLFDAHSLDRLDNILNQQYSGGMTLVAEKRFTYKVEESTEFAILLIWAEYTPGFKNVEALNGLGQLLRRLF